MSYMATAIKQVYTQYSVRSLQSLDLKKNAKDQSEGQSNKCVSCRKSEGRKKQVEYNLATKTQTTGAHV